MSMLGTHQTTSDHQERIETVTPQTITLSPHINQDAIDHCHSLCSFIEEVICKVPGSLRIHPSLWSKDDVIQWLRWAEEEYSLKKADDSKFIMNGRALCILTKLDFKARSPSSGDVLYELLQCIKNHRQGLVKQSFFSQCARKQHHLQRQTCISTSCRFLWDYLHKLLDDRRYESCIQWEDKELKIFKVMDPHKLAAFWGNHKNRPNMTYEKMSRALRQYYKISLIKKESGKRLTFRFLRSPRERPASEKILKSKDTDDSCEDVIDISP
ncbi:transcription factor ETV7-like isoform 4-T4 [Anomaloglossus baeobatrachus]|uniref:transcription factor ETV7-like isoform X3 n=1 Tax=Anomaloglossus baeobatrachus TaxID=238106 RepID=UPI003F4F8450